eukprot:TRINITY_DN57790_c0_g1_i1.p1 TRINITY_DN57790_c0_g1~~TRINITY_DN57790_c0_g1_i1.p1  ORF type:complete len:263 (+),score=46.88 TRINITY_DN57790_c0_g1_i1:55-843(+)
MPAVHVKGQGQNATGHEPPIMDTPPRPTRANKRKADRDLAKSMPGPNGAWAADMSPVRRTDHTKSLRMLSPGPKIGLDQVTAGLSECSFHEEAVPSANPDVTHEHVVCAGLWPSFVDSHQNSLKCVAAGADPLCVIESAEEQDFGGSPKGSRAGREPPGVSEPYICHVSRAGLECLEDKFAQGQDICVEDVSKLTASEHAADLPDGSILPLDIRGAGSPFLDLPSPTDLDDAFEKLGAAEMVAGLLKARDGVSGTSDASMAS